MSSADQQQQFILYGYPLSPQGALTAIIDFGRFAYRTMTPGPLSPHFMPGGVFESLNEDLTLLVFFIIVFAIVDFTIIKPKIHPKARYFALHAVANAIVALTSFPDVYRALLVDPPTCFTGKSCSAVPSQAAVGMHLYHCIAFPLTSEDIFHHMMFVFPFEILCIMNKHMAGVGSNFPAFFLTGLPGGIDYVMLVLMKHEKISKLQERGWNAIINVWLRAPSMTVYAFLNFQNWYSGAAVCNGFQMWFGLLLFWYNGQHYSREVVQSFATHTERARVAKAKAKDEKQVADTASSSSSPPTTAGSPLVSEPETDNKNPQQKTTNDGKKGEFPKLPPAVMPLDGKALARTENGNSGKNNNNGKKKKNREQSPVDLSQPFSPTSPLQRSTLYD